MSKHKDAEHDKPIPAVEHETDRHLLREPDDTDKRPLAEKLGPESLVPNDQDPEGPIGGKVSDAAKENADARKESGADQ